MTKRTNQHYVPQAYLRHFTFDGSHLHAFDKSTQKSGQPSTRNMASEMGFYDFPSDARANGGAEMASSDRAAEGLATTIGYAQIVDDALTEREKLLNEVFDRFLDHLDQGLSITHEQRILMAHYVVLQYLRTKEMRQELVEIVEKATTLDLEARHGVSLKAANLRLVYNRNQAPLLHADVLFDSRVVNDLHQAVMSHIWLVGHTLTAQPLYTSDHPVVVIPHVNGAGFASAGVEIVLPLGPRRALVLCERTAFCHLVAADGKHIHLNEPDAKRYNYWQLASSYRWIFSAEDTFDFARRVCREQPELCLLDRSRYTVASGQEPITSEQS